MFAASTMTVTATPTEESIKAKEAQISEAKKERDGLKSAKTDLEKVKKQLVKKVIIHQKTVLILSLLCLSYRISLTFQIYP